MKLCVIGPTRSLDKLSIGNMHLILVDQVLENTHYSEFYAEKRFNGNYIILDNCAHENKSASSITKMIAVSNIITPDEIVLPDVIGDCEGTLKAIEEGIDEILDHFAMCSFMAVPQGHTQEEWQECLDAIMQRWGEYVDVIGIPRVNGDRFGSWIPSVERALSYHKDMHLLGSPHNLDSAAEIERTFPNKVRSTDTAKPIHYALAGRCFLDVGANVLDRTQRNPDSRPSNFFDLVLGDHDIELAQYNIQLMRASINDTQDF